MPARRHGGAFSAAALLLGIAAAAPASPLDALAPMDTVLRRLAAPAGFAASDLDLLAVFPGAPPEAPSAVTRLLRNPASADSLVPALRRDLREKASGGFVRAEPLWKRIDVAEPGGSKAPLPARLVDAEDRLQRFASRLAPAETEFLLREVPPLFRPDVEDTLLNPIEREAARLRGNAVADSVMRLAGRLPMETLAEAARDLDAALAFLLDKARDGNPAAMVRYLRALSKRHDIPVAIGSPGNDTHRLAHGIVFDPGGDDRYEFPAAPRPGTWLMVIDLSGNDTYVARDSVGGAAAFLSALLIADLAGDDRYLGNDFAFGSALMGFSRLYDAAGDDAYEARNASLGFAFRGLGILEDAAGNDVYSSAYLSQAASSSFGFGLLLDHDGDDRYETRAVFLDDLRYRDRFLSLSQGFSTGLAPRHAGGVAVLWDRAGDDAYVADIFGQGAGYWFALGLLMDDAGDDRYSAWQYAQGAGVHFAAGMLLDGGGNDARVSKGVSQGCGHDGALGLLVDAAGDDSTTAVDMSAGAGSANGLGVLLDLAGNDAWIMADAAMTLGHGDMRRDRGSLGFFLDLGGKDAYSDTTFGPGTVRRVYDGKKRGEGFGVRSGEDEKRKAKCGMMNGE